ncbi:hypothetical protein ZIOFF_029500 [Zingiber officinale]|uniref:Uncharacterized protein n=1 Tax=Zingiber officinale TaxID=94328 RepID=A0A8J5GRN7_ZINOF|nr:hypothetical protein ZIOFF_029500 [Zingiber officinale]
MELCLSNVGLFGTIPAWFSDFVLENSLYYLDLSSNELNGELPSILCKHPDLTNNSFEGLTFFSFVGFAVGTLYDRAFLSLTAVTTIPLKPYTCWIRSEGGKSSVQPSISSTTNSPCWLGSRARLKNKESTAMLSWKRGKDGEQKLGRRRRLADGKRAQLLAPVRHQSEQRSDSRVASDVGSPQEGATAEARKFAVGTLHGRAFLSLTAVTTVPLKPYTYWIISEGGKSSVQPSISSTTNSPCWLGSRA